MKRYLCCVGLLLCLGCERDPSCVELSTCPRVIKSDGGADTSDASVIDASDLEVRVDASSETRVDAASDRTDVRTDLSTNDVSADASVDAKVGEDGSDASSSFDAGDGADMRTCDTGKRPLDEPCLIDEKYGVFVSPVGDDITGLGTRVSPFLTLSKAIGTANPDRRVYACDNGTGYAEQVVAGSSTKIFGGFNCVDWSYASNQHVVVRAPASPALSVPAGSTGILIEDVEFIAPGASDPSSDAGPSLPSGASSIAAIIDTSMDVVLHRVRLIAGRGADGVNGADGSRGDNAQNPDAAQKGHDSLCAPDAGLQQVGGAWPMSSDCGSRGGNGGTANQGQQGTEGVSGIPSGNMNGGGVASNGTVGANGAMGAHGIAATMVGTFSPSGYAPASGGTAGDGKVGQGGGGGGASSPPLGGFCLGASGGAGGMGGCGGKAGGGGQGGGASVALLSWLSSAVTLDTCVLIANNGGAAGNGGIGGNGGFGMGGAVGGNGAGSIANGGSGGPGGSGGTAGSGAGGTGGPSYGIVSKGTSPQRIGTTPVPAMGGAPGVGGSNGTKAPDGTMGAMSDELALPP